MNKNGNVRSEQQYRLQTDQCSNLSKETPLPVQALHQSFEISTGSEFSRATALLTNKSPALPPSLCGGLIRWFQNSVWPGLGLFGESYLLFSIGILKPIWAELYPDCFNNIECSPRLLYSLTYSVVIGVIVGMIVVGYQANFIGRRKGSILTASLMTGGAVGLFLTSFVGNAVWMYRSMSVLLFLFGLGVGGEYPLSASSASEKAMQELWKQPNPLSPKEKMARLYQEIARGGDLKQEPLPSTSDLSFESVGLPQQARGRQVQLVFAMQGVGIWLNSVTVMLLLWATGQTGENDEYDHEVLVNIWRITYLVGLLILAFVLVTRVIYLQESQVWMDDKQQRDQQQYASSRTATPMVGTGANPRPPSDTGMPPAIAANSSTVSSLSNFSVAQYGLFDENILQPVPSTEPEEDLQASTTTLLFRNYGVRLFGASTSWLLWDISFYGNKLFQSTFLLALTGEETTLLEFTFAATLNSTVALLGYFGAAAVLDHPHVGRVRLQTVGFFVTGALFVLCGFCFYELSSGWLVTLYLISSFFGQLGPNATTFLIPAEIFPTETRTFCHGICAASGKVGALIAAVLFNFLERDVDLFLICGYASFFACLITVWTIPETNSLDLLEVDRKWRMTLEGRKGEYSGAANHPDYLSMYERNKIGLQY